MHTIVPRTIKENAWLIMAFRDITGVVTNAKKCQHEKHPKQNQGKTVRLSSP